MLENRRLDNGVVIPAAIYAVQRIESLIYLHSLAVDLSGPSFYKLTAVQFQEILPFATRVRSDKHKDVAAALRRQGEIIEFGLKARVKK